MQVAFRKMQGLGNDFVLLDERRVRYDLAPAQFARIADRRLGVGCDQVLVLTPPERDDANARYSIYNADGSSAEHCGNGVRCVARYLREVDGVSGPLHVEIGQARYELSFTATDDVRVDMGRPRFAPAEIPLAVDAAADSYELALDGEVFTFGSVSIGNPHAVFLVDDVDTAPVERIGAALQHHALFPARVNVGFMQVVDARHIRLRVYERGVGETPACGTGACAAVAVGRRRGTLAEKTTVQLTGGELMIDWSGTANDHLWMTGPAETAFNGIIEL